VLTAGDVPVAVLYTKACNRLLVLLTAANQPQAPPGFRTALTVIARHAGEHAGPARLPALRENWHKRPEAPGQRSPGQLTSEELR